MIDWASLAKSRTAEDAILGQVRLRLDGQEYTLPVLNSGPNARWKAQMMADLSALLGVLQTGMDSGDTTAIVAALATEALLPKVKAALFAYDVTGVLPPETELDERIRDIDYVRALVEVWAAANPLVVTGLEWIAAILTASSSLRTSTRRKPTGGRRRTSGTN